MTGYRNVSDTGEAWLGAVPAHWQKANIQSITKPKANRNRGDLPLLSVYRDYGVKMRTEDDGNHNVIPEDLSNYKVVEAGDLVINKMKTWQGSLGVSPHTGVVSPAYIVCDLSDDIDSKFAHYLLRSSRYIYFYNKISYGVRVDQWDMHYQDFRKIPIFVPTLEEQKTIVRYLDKKLEQIDTFIQNKRRLTELLEEQKTAIINKAVTQGLDSRVEMKDSGVEWLGSFNSNWRLLRLKFLLSESLQYGANEEAKLDDPKLPRYIRITDFDDNGKLRKDTFRSLTVEAAEPYLLNGGDILFARSGGTVGKTFLFGNYSGQACFAGYLIRARADQSKILPDYLYMFTRSGIYAKWKDSIFIQATIQNISADKYANLLVPVPTIEEQEKIISLLKTELTDIDLVIETTYQEIDLINEYRTTLISDAVTGKIDVRGHV